MLSFSEKLQIYGTIYLKMKTRGSLYHLNKTERLLLESMEILISPLK